ncbi:MAG TPA: HIT family protein [Phycisphaerales bacterium]|nr:HIT family protein [Phycisphaerales bacterium]
MGCPLCEVVGRVGRGEHPQVVGELAETVVILGDNQGARGWCTLVLREHCEHLAELSVARQERVFGEVARVAAAVRSVFGPVRINYECLGNVAPHVHWHVVPRHADDPTPRATVWGWTAEQLRGSMGEGERVELAGKLRGALSGGVEE